MRAFHFTWSLILDYLIQSFLFHFPRFALFFLSILGQGAVVIILACLRDWITDFFGKHWSGRTACGSCFNLIFWQFDQIRCWFNPRFPLKYILHTTHWVSFITHLNDLCRCFNNCKSELNSSKQHLHKLLTLLAIVSFRSYAFPPNFVILKSISVNLVHDLFLVFQLKYLFLFIHSSAPPLEEP